MGNTRPRAYLDAICSSMFRCCNTAKICRPFHADLESFLEQCFHPFSSCDFITMATSRFDAADLFPNGGQRRGEPLAPHEDALPLDYHDERKEARKGVGGKRESRARAPGHPQHRRTRLPRLIRRIRYLILNLIAPHTHSHRSV